jgi:hypothetical protein
MRVAGAPVARTVAVLVTLLVALGVTTGSLGANFRWVSASVVCPTPPYPIDFSRGK